MICRHHFLMNWRWLAMVSKWRLNLKGSLCRCYCCSFADIQFCHKNAHSFQPQSLLQLLGYEFVELSNCLKLLSRGRLINFERYYLIVILILTKFIVLPSQAVPVRLAMRSWFSSQRSSQPYCGQ